MTSNVAGTVPPPALFIRGEWISAASRESLALVNPASLAEIGRVPIATAADLDLALEAAAQAARPWRDMTAYERSAILRRAAALIRDRRQDIATQLTREQGKTLAEALGEVSGAADTFDWYAEEGRRAYGRVIPARTTGHRWIVAKEPVGPVAAFSPWNFPAMLSSRKIAASLAAGCPCIIKPAEETPSPALAFARALHEAGLPRGVLNVVFGHPAQVSSHLIASPVIRKITFTGSTGVGKHLARLAADGMKKATFELGGHSPVVVFDDVDIDAVVRTVLAGKIRNAGQVCVAPTRLFVQRAIHSRFVESFAQALQSVRVGNGLDAGNQMGALANGRRIDAMERLVSDARDHGARIVAGGTRGAGEGHFWRPTLMADVPDAAIVMNDEPFGPVAVANAFDTLEDVVRQANRLPYGLAGYAFTHDTRRSMAIADALECGVVGINNLTVSTAEAPFGGIKESGYGSEAGLEGLDAFLNVKFISEAPSCPSSK